uniref:mitogen-activated protein kinase n=1 Tax=Cynoglossus semilaevis TaxID=244447 RepID=A0A3P8WDP0_CYNSE
AHSYLSLEKLGEGAYASVYKVSTKHNENEINSKTVSISTAEPVILNPCVFAASLLKGLKHANVVLLHDIIHNSETLTLVFEYIFMFQLLRGLTFIHSRKILHRDLKPQNLLISYLGELKLADFGLARSKSIPSQTFSADVVTLWYRPPDVLLGSTEYSTALDMWGAGCIFIEMLQGAPAFPGVTDVFDQLQKIWMVLGVPSESSWPGVTSLSIINGLFKKYIMFPNTCIIIIIIILNSHTEGLVQRLLMLVPSERISAQEALQHPYFNTLPTPIMHLNDSKLKLL